MASRAWSSQYSNATCSTGTGAPGFLFLNKRRDRLKALWWERDGLTIWYKRLERGTFEMPPVVDGAAHLTLDATDLAMLLGGVSLATARRRNRYARAS